MEDFYNTKRLALILAVQAEIEGMKAQNENCKYNNEHMHYVEDSFNEKAEELRNLAHACNEQL